MSLLVHPENQRLIWDIINNNPFVVQFFQTNVNIKKEQWFKSIMEHFYNTYNGRTIDKAELNQINKEILTYMIQNLHTITTPTPPTIDDPPNRMQNTIDTPPIPENNREEMYKNQFLQKQQEYSALFDKKPPPEINFGETEKDVAISNMDELIQKQQAERDAYMNLHPMPAQGILPSLNSSQSDNSNNNIKLVPDEPSTPTSHQITTHNSTYNSQIIEMLNKQMSEIESLRGLIVDMSKQLVQTNQELMLIKQTNISQYSSHTNEAKTDVQIQQTDDVLVETVDSDNE